MAETSPLEVADGTGPQTRASPTESARLKHETLLGGRVAAR